jgi:hypothetical protein
VPAASRGATDAGLSAAGVGLLIIVGAALLALVFATIPARVLNAVSARLAERRQDIGLAMAVGLAASAALFIVIVGASL